jgi:hypothetical protein
MWKGLKNLKVKKHLCAVSFKREELLMGDGRLRMEQSLLRGSEGWGDDIIHRSTDFGPSSNTLTNGHITILYTIHLRYKSSQFRIYFQ